MIRRTFAGCLLLALLAALISCTPTRDEKAAALGREMDRFDQDLDRTEELARKLSAEWRDVVQGYGRARDAYARARLKFDAAAKDAETARDVYQRASSEWQRASVLWDFYRSMVLVAAQIDAATLSGAAVCSETSTATYRRQLERQGVDLNQTSHLI